MENVWGAVIAALLTLILALLSLQWKDQRDSNKEQRQFNCSITAKVETKMDKRDCEKERRDCAHGPGWDTFDAHSHEGLAAGARVVKGIKA